MQTNGMARRAPRPHLGCHRAVTPAPSMFLQAVGTARRAIGCTRRTYLATHLQKLSFMLTSATQRCKRWSPGRTPTHGTVRKRIHPCDHRSFLCAQTRMYIALALCGRAPPFAHEGKRAPLAFSHMLSADCLCCAGSRQCRLPRPPQTAPIHQHQLELSSSCAPVMAGCAPLCRACCEVRFAGGQARHRGTRRARQPGSSLARAVCWANTRSGQDWARRSTAQASAERLLFQGSRASPQRPRCNRCNAASWTSVRCFERDIR